MLGLHGVFSSLEKNFNPSSNLPMNSEETFFKYMVIVYEMSKFPMKHFEIFPNISFSKISARNIAELLVLSSQIHLSDTVGNGSVRNKCFPSSLDTEQIPKIKRAITCPSVPRYFFNSIGN